MTGGPYTPESEAFALSDGIRVLEKPLDAEDVRRIVAEIASREPS